MPADRASVMSDTLYCSFCGKNQHEVRLLITGPRVYICDECVDLCAGIVAEQRSPAKQQFETLQTMLKDPSPVNSD